MWSKWNSNPACEQDSSSLSEFLKGGREVMIEKYTNILDREHVIEILNYKEGVRFDIELPECDDLEDRLRRFSGTATCLMDKVFVSAEIKPVVRATTTANDIVTKMVVVMVRVGHRKKVETVDTAHEQEMLLAIHHLGFSPAFLGAGSIESGDQSLPLIIMTYIPHSSILHQKIADSKHIFHELWRIANKLNSMRLVHGDLAPRNALYDKLTGKIYVIHLEDSFDNGTVSSVEEMAECIDKAWAEQNW